MAAAQIVLMDRKSHTLPLAGKEWTFELNKPRTITDPALIEYCRKMPAGMFSVTDVELPKPAAPPKAAVEASADAPDTSEEPSSDEPEESSRARSPRRRKVKMGG